MKPEDQVYSVQAILPDGAKDGPPVSTHALSALQAAQNVTGEPLALHGRVVRAQVRSILEGYATSLTTLYAQDPPNSGG